jgi:signal transduction histidine kinase/CheY-like chemotaxis protein/ligand-binding sensor domain-containing protein/AraC-like DNA-binding protein
MRRKWPGLVVGLWGLAGLIMAQESSQWPCQHIDKRAGLSNSAITSIYMDREDYVWFGTWDGLNRYDGSSITVYKPDPLNKRSISNNIIRELHEDGRGQFWIVTHAGINLFNPDNNSFKSFFDTVNFPFQEYNMKACIGPDSAIWIGLNGWGIGKYAESVNRFLPFRTNTSNDEWLKSVMDIGSNDGNIYALSHHGDLFCIRNNNIRYTYHINVKPNIQQYKFLVLDHQYFLAIPADNGYVNLYNLLTDSVASYRLKTGSAPISCIAPGLKNDEIWIGTESGSIFRIIRQKGQFKVQDMDSYVPLLAQKKLKILSITETSQDILWIGTDGDGIYKFLTKERVFNSIAYGPTSQGQLSQSIVRCIYEDGRNLYMGTRGGGLNVLNLMHRTENQVYNTGNGLSNNAVLAVNKDLRGNIWIGVDGEGIDMMEANTGKIYHFPRDLNLDQPVNFASVYTICVAEGNNIWLGTSGYGIIHLKVQKQNNEKYDLVTYEKINTRNSPMNSNIVYSIIEDKPGKFWFGSRFGGLYYYNSLSSRFETMGNEGPNGFGLSNNDVLSLCRDSKNHLWIGTSGGLNFIDLNRADHSIIQYTQSNGLINNTIHGILEDQFGRIWISTNEGLSLFNYKDHSFKNFDWNDGLQNNEFTDGAVFKSTLTNKLYFGGIDGTDIVSPEKLDSSFVTPRLALTEFQVHNVVITPDDNTNILKRRINLTHSIHLNYNQNFITFHFTTLDFWNKQRCRYAYYIENLDKDWIYINKQSFINLVNVPPGKYKLHLKYTNENGSWSRDVRSIAIIITPPFYASRPAYAMYIVLILLLQAGIIFSIRKKTKRKKTLAIDTIRRQHEAELNNYKLQFFTNIAHEFRTPLTLIMGPVAILMKNNTEGSLKKYLTTIYKNALRLQKLIQELIEFRKIETGNAKLEVAEKNLNVFTADIIDIFQEYAVDRDIDLLYEPFQGPSNGFIDSNKIEKVLINLISNAIKYTPAQGKVWVTLTIDNQEANFEVSDTGIGISSDIIERIFDPFFHGSENFAEREGIARGTGIGLSLTKGLVEAHKGTIRVESQVGRGSRFIFSIPIDINDYPVIVPSGEHIMVKTRLKEKINTEFESSEYDKDIASNRQADRDMDEQVKEYQILIVDDNPEVLSMLGDILPVKYGVNLANSAIKALDLVASRKIDLVISDVVMPDMDGLTLCQRIKDNIETSHIPLILLTAKGDIEHRIQGLQSGADSYIPKPFHPDHLFVRIEKLLQTREIIRNKFKSLALIGDEKFTQGLGKPDDEFLTKLAQFIQDEMANTELDAEQMASFMNLSKTGLYRKIKSLTGLSPHLLINQYRLKRAAWLLKKGEMNVSEVIYETGFNSRSYFYRSFNELFHCAPKDYGKVIADPSLNLKKISFNS